MRYLAIACLVLFCLSCQQDEDPITCRDTMVCEGGCLFDIYNVEGKMRFASCFGVWGVICNPESQDEGVFVLFEEVPRSFRVEDKTVIISATAFENTFPLLLPDPFLMPRLLKGELCELTNKS